MTSSQSHDQANVETLLRRLNNLEALTKKIEVVENRVTKVEQRINRMTNWFWPLIIGGLLGWFWDDIVRIFTS